MVSASPIKSTECDGFTGRIKDLCAGCGHDGRTNPPRNSVDAFREQHGLSPLPPLENQTVEVVNHDGITSKRCCEKPPTLLQMVASAGTAAIQWVTSSVKLSQAEIDDRRELCRTCEAFNNGWCGHCNCNIHLKTQIAEQFCPVGKWSAASDGMPRRARLHPFVHDGSSPRFITTAQLMKDAHTLAAMLPADTPFIIGIARSGLCVATMVSMLLHLPLKIFRQSSYDLIDGGNGWRLTGNTGGTGSPVVIDDTVMSGNSFKHCMPVIHQQYPNAISAAVYVNPQSLLKPDIWAVDLPWPHILEWNVFNSILSPHIAYDFDGILCHDCPAGSDDDGPRYAEFLKNTKPLYLCRKTRIPLIVTARLEKYREQTMDWLSRHGIAVDKLIMGPWANNHERAMSDIAAYKASHFKEFLKLNHAISPPMFAESEPAQAQRIAELSGGIVICPAAGRCYP